MLLRVRQLHHQRVMQNPLSMGALGEISQSRKPPTVSIRMDGEPLCYTSRAKLLKPRRDISVTPQL